MLTRLAVAARRRFGGSPMREPPQLPLYGHPPAEIPTPLLDRLSDHDLQALNALLPWRCFTTDSRGRRLGNAAWSGKRQDSQPIPDPRIVALDQRFPLGNRSVLEVGCFEGVHTIGLCRFARSVTAADARIENIAKTAVRTALYGVSPRVLLWDVESGPPPAGERPDVVHHVGVLYHLRDPVKHLIEIAAVSRDFLWLDTHVATPEQATETYTSHGRVVRYKRYSEAGRQDVFSGMHDHAKWLTRETIVAVLADGGFSSIETVEERAERNGPRVLIAAAR